MDGRVNTVMFVSQDQDVFMEIVVFTQTVVNVILDGKDLFVTKQSASKLFLLVFFAQGTYK